MPTLHLTIPGIQKQNRDKFNIMNEFSDITGQSKPKKTFRNAGARVTVDITERLLRCLEKSLGTIKELRMWREPLR